MSQLKVLSIRQPYASLVAIGAKVVETRSRRTSHRGLVGIHASRTFTGAERALVNRSPFHGALFAADPEQVAFGLDSTLPRGQVIAVAELVDCIPSEQLVRLFNKHPRPCLRYGDGPDEFVRATRHEQWFGNYAPERFGWVLNGVQRLENPVDAKGQLGIWTAPPDVEQLVLAQLESDDEPSVGERIDQSFDLFHPEVQR